MKWPEGETSKVRFARVPGAKVEKTLWWTAPGQGDVKLDEKQKKKIPHNSQFSIGWTGVMGANL